MPVNTGRQCFPQIKEGLPLAELVTVIVQLHRVNTGERRRHGAEVGAADFGGSDALEVGARIRLERQRQKMSLRELASRSGLSHGYLSQAERGISAIALTSLAAVARALGKELADLLPGGASTHQEVNANGDFCWVQRGTRPAQTVQSGERYYRLLSARVPGMVLEPMLVRIHPGEDWQSPVTHPGEEFAYVLEGELLVTVGKNQHRLVASDSIHLRSTQPHNIHNPTDRVVTVVSVVTPRLF